MFKEMCGAHRGEPPDLRAAGRPDPPGRRLVRVGAGAKAALVGPNGAGTSTFLRLLAGDAVPHRGAARLGSRVEPGHFVQTHARPDLHGRAPAEIVMAENALTRNDAMAALARYELAPAGSRPFETLSGGQRARLLLLDGPTDNLDLAGAEALQDGLASYSGTVLAVTHDRWFAADFDRYLVFGADGAVRESDAPVWTGAGV